MSTGLDDNDIPQLAMLISPERLAAFQKLTGSTRAAIELHRDMLRLNAQLMNVIACVEIALRNAVSDNLTSFFGTPDWLTHPPAPFQWRKTENENARKALDSARRSEYAKLSQSEKAALEVTAFPHGRPVAIPHLKRAIERRKQINVPIGKVIAETTFYTWKRLYSADYEQTLWRPTLKRTFPDKKLKRATVAENLEVLYQARNRLAHHEPVLRRRLRDALVSIKFVGENLLHADSALPTPLLKMIGPDLEATEKQAAALHAALDSFVA